MRYVSGGAVCLSNQCPTAVPMWYCMLRCSLSLRTPQSCLKIQKSFCQAEQSQAAVANVVVIVTGGTHAAYYLLDVVHVKWYPVQ